MCFFLHENERERPLPLSHPPDALVQRWSQHQLVAQRPRSSLSLRMSSEERVRIREASQLSLDGLVLDGGLLSLPLDGRVAEVECGDAVAIEASHIVRVAGLQLQEVGAVDYVAAELHPLVPIVHAHPAVE